MRYNSVTSMNHKATLIIGILVLILPYLGFPRDWDDAFYTILGAILVLISLTAIWRRYLSEAVSQSHKEENVVYREHDPRADINSSSNA